MKILVHIPSRERPDQLLATVKEYQRLAIGPITILLSLDLDDDAMVARRREFQRLPGMLIVWGKSASKIDAVNRDIAEHRWDILIGASDDMVPVVEGYDQRIRSQFTEGTDLCLWCSDGHQSRLCTIPVMGRKAYDDLGYVYHPEYLSYWADDEWTERWTAAGKLVKVQGPMFRHKHWIFGEARFDSLYQRNKAPKKTDHATYNRRKALNFPR